jgi:hypothetical protein
VTEVKLPDSKNTFQTSLNSFIGFTTAHQDLTSKLLRIKEEVSHEVDQFQALGTITKDSDLLKRKRLLFLFVRDLLDGMSGEVFSNKQNHETVLTLKTTRVSWESKLMTWMFIFLMNFGMLFYVYLFAMTQTHARQSAWFQSFVIWLLFEIFLSSTGMVIFFHLLIPLSVLTNVTKVKEQVVNDFISFGRKLIGAHCRESRAVPQKEELQSPSGTSPSSFNSAKYFFTSWKLASLFPEFPESKLILQYSTLWPKKGNHSSSGKMDLSREYDQAVILTALSRILVYFLTTLLRFHSLIQEIVIQMASDSGMGYLCLLFIRLYQFNSYLLLVTVFVLVFSLHFLVTAFSPKTMELKSLSSLSSSVDGNGSDNDNDSDENVSGGVVDEEMGGSGPLGHGATARSAGGGGGRGGRGGAGVIAALRSPYQFIISPPLPFPVPPPADLMSRMSSPLEIDSDSSSVGSVNPHSGDHSHSSSSEQSTLLRSDEEDDATCSFPTLDDDVWEVTWGDEEKDGHWGRQWGEEEEEECSWQEGSSSSGLQSSSTLQSNSNSDEHSNSDSDSTENSRRVSEVMHAEELENPFEEFDLLVLEQPTACISSRNQKV